MGSYIKKSEKQIPAGWKCLMPIMFFLVLYMVGTILPLEMTPHYHNYMSRVWNWTEIVIMVLSIYYIFKAKIFHWRQAAAAVLIGGVCLVSLFRDPRTADIIVTSVCVMVSFYAGCRLYELADRDNASIHTGIAGSIGYFGLGAVISIPLAALNLLYYSFSRAFSRGMREIDMLAWIFDQWDKHLINVDDVLKSAVYALKPAIAEEVIFRFFLLAYAYYILRGKGEKPLSNIYIYILLIIPHELLHYPDVFVESPGWAIVMCLLGSVPFGIPMAMLMKRKNLQMAMGMHWFIDFARFSAGF